jgi:hypothetical protein
MTGKGEEMRDQIDWDGLGHSALESGHSECGPRRSCIGEQSGC